MYGVSAGPGPVGAAGVVAPGDGWQARSACAANMATVAAPTRHLRVIGLSADGVIGVMSSSVIARDSRPIPERPEAPKR
jgi:hypothetical protein